MMRVAHATNSRQKMSNVEFPLFVHEDLYTPYPVMPPAVLQLQHHFQGSPIIFAFASLLRLKARVIFITRRQKACLENFTFYDLTLFSFEKMKCVKKKFIDKTKIETKKNHELFMVYC
jgi:hypothetical protein